MMLARLKKGVLFIYLFIYYFFHDQSYTRRMDTLCMNFVTPTSIHHFCNELKYAIS